VQASKQQVIVFLGRHELKFYLERCIQRTLTNVGLRLPSNTLLTPPQQCLEQMLHLLNSHRRAFLGEITQARFVKVAVPMTLQERLQLGDKDGTLVSMLIDNLRE
jgi:hypothetical protein